MSVTWDAENRMTSFGTAMTADYTTGGIRAWKGDGQGNRTYYIYDGGVPLLELDGQGSVTALNTFGPTGLHSRHTGTGSTFYTFDGQERLDSFRTSLNSSAYDAFGSKLIKGAEGCSRPTEGSSPQLRGPLCLVAREGSEPVAMEWWEWRQNGQRIRRRSRSSSRWTDARDTCLRPVHKVWPDRAG